MEPICVSLGWEFCDRHTETLGRVETRSSFDKTFFSRRKVSYGRGSLWNPAFCGSLAGHCRVTLQNLMSGSLFDGQHDFSLNSSMIFL